MALVWPEPLGEIVRRGGGVMSSRLGAVTAVSFLVWPYTLEIELSSREHAVLCFCPVLSWFFSEPIVGPTLLYQIYLPSFPPFLLLLPIPRILGLSSSTDCKYLYSFGIPSVSRFCIIYDIYVYFFLSCRASI